MKTKQFQISGIQVLVEYKKIKNMYIRVEPGSEQPKMTVPIGTTDAVICDALRQKEEWLKKIVKKHAGHPMKAPPKYLTGEIHPLWGKEYPIEVISGKENQVYLHDGKIRIEFRGHSEDYMMEQRKYMLEEFYRAQLKAMVPNLLPKCIRIVGKTPKEWRVKNMKTRWGTCNVEDRRIWLNLQLAKKPVECLEYVIIHELTHLYESSHNSRFWKFMDHFCPDWRTIRKRLNQDF